MNTNGFKTNIEALTEKEHGDFMRALLVMAALRESGCPWNPVN